MTPDTFDQGHAQHLGAGSTSTTGVLRVTINRMADELCTLRERLRREPLPLRGVVRIVDDLLAHVATIHEHGAVDRAIAPERIVLVHADGRLHARLAPAPAPTSGEPDLAAFERTVGSFSFMAPEQIRGSADVDARADIYAVGAIALFALTRRLPFEASNALTLIALKLERPAPTLESITGRPFPSLLELFVATAMAIDPALRYPRLAVARAAWSEASRSVGE